jgi:predicted enzyme related to lactoylglutathione lyase
MSDSAPRARFVWADLMSPDPNGAIAFYTKVNAWGTQQFPGPSPYTMWTAGPAPVGGVTEAQGGQPPHWLSYIHADDIEKTVARAKELGATVAVPPTDIPTVGRYAVIQDPQGASVGIYQSLTPQPDPGDTRQLGEFSWHELATTDVKGAFAFYSALLGWETTSEMDMGELGVYHMFGFNGVPMGGIYKKPAEMQGPPNWLPYVKVADVNAAASTITGLGGQVINGPMEVPGGDWIAQGVDPQGAMFAVHAAAKA